MTFSQKELDAYDKVIATQKGMVRKGAKSAYTSLNGHMTSFLLDAGGLAVRLSAEDREAFVKKHKTKPVIVYKTVMKEYVHMPSKLLLKTKDAARVFAASIAYIKSLKPKPTTKKATTKKAAKKPAAKKAVRKKTVTKKKAAAKNKATRKKAATKKSTRKKPAAKKKPTAKKKAVRKKATKKKASGPKKTTRKKAAPRKTARKTRRKATTKKTVRKKAARRR